MIQCSTDYAQHARCLIMHNSYELMLCLLCLLPPTTARMAVAPAPATTKPTPAAPAATSRAPSPSPCPSQQCGLHTRWSTSRLSTTSRMRLWSGPATTSAWCDSPGGGQGGGGGLFTIVASATLSFSVAGGLRLASDSTAMSSTMGMKTDFLRLWGAQHRSHAAVSLVCRLLRQP